MATLGPSWIGRTIGNRYEIESILGRGGMSSVYRATDPNLHRKVAVKIVHQHLSDNEEFIQRFEQEAAVVAQLLIHRDLKPANVMINLLNEPILMDFGIAKIVGGRSHTVTGAAMGTAAYMSPEQVRGDKADHRSDIYSLGIMFYKMFSGEMPLLQW